MRFSQYLIPTLKEVPAEAQVASHVLMLRAAMIRKLAAGIYTYLPLGLRSLRKVENIVREEMNRAGAHELLMPAVQPAELWQESGRWQFYGPELLRFKDRKGGDFCFGPTHEEVITDLVRGVIRSYRQLPINLYQIQMKFRDEIRPRFGLLRGREFLMKDAYSFDLTEEGARKSYQIMYDAYGRIFQRCGLNFKAVEAATGNIGGSLSHEFQVLAESGEDAILSCDKCSYAANADLAVAKPSEPPGGDCSAYELVATPNQRTVEEVTAFLGVAPRQLIKTLIYLADGQPIAAMVRGDAELNEVKLGILLAANELVLADDATVARVTSAPVGFAGPVGLPAPLYADHAINGATDMVVGANQADAHLKHVQEGRDFQVQQFGDLRVARPGDRCPRCDGGKYESFRGIEVGQVFYLGDKYSKKMNAAVLDEAGQERVLIMGCYGIGIGRTMASAIEQNHDADGMIWPMALAPFQVAICPIGAHKDLEIARIANELHEQLESAGVEALLDDRGERPGVMFKDIDLLGIPLRLTVARKAIEQNVIEWKLRREKGVSLTPREGLVPRVKDFIAAECRK